MSFLEQSMLGIKGFSKVFDTYFTLVGSNDLTERDRKLVDSMMADYNTIVKSLLWSHSDENTGCNDIKDSDEKGSVSTVEITYGILESICEQLLEKHNLQDKYRFDVFIYDGVFYIHFVINDGTGPTNHLVGIGVGFDTACKSPFGELVDLIETSLLTMEGIPDSEDKVEDSVPESEDLSENIPDSDEVQLTSAFESWIENVQRAKDRLNEDLKTQSPKA